MEPEICFGNIGFNAGTNRHGGPASWMVTKLGQQTAGSCR